MNLNASNQFTLQNIFRKYLVKGNCVHFHDKKCTSQQAAYCAKGILKRSPRYHGKVSELQGQLFLALVRCNCHLILLWYFAYKKCQRHEKLGLPRQINFTVAFQKQNILFGYIHWYIIEPSLEMNEMALKLDFLNNDKTFARVERVGENCSFTAPNSRRHIVAHKWSVSGMICQKILSTASFGPIHGVKSDVIS